MKKILLMTLALTVCAGATMADHFGLCTDEAGTDCTLSTLVGPPANNTFYVIHHFNANGATAAQFKINDLSGLFAASQQTTFLAIGTWNTDLSLAYGSCLLGDIIAIQLNFFWFGNPISGCNNTLEVAAAPTSPLPGEIATVECDFETVTSATGGSGWVSTDGSAENCPVSCCNSVNPTQENTWGGIKALYR